MMLFLSAQDIHRLEAAIVGDDRLLHEASVAAPPEQFLASLNALMAGWGVEWKEVERVMVVTGPGSFTSTRLIITIANGIAFGENVPVVGVENPSREPLVELIRRNEWKQAATQSAFAIPVYDRPPNITQRRK
jgi:tRNA threonylcarbamoyladenosine biosynthesis protein TsaB